MSFICLDHSSSPATSAYTSPVEAVRDMPFSEYFESDVIRSTLNDVRAAGVVYPLRRACTATFIPGVGEFLVKGFSPLFVGRGETLGVARRDFLLAVHASFQELLHKRPFEMTDDDNRRWSVLSAHIDVAVYRNQTPIQVRQFGKITQARPYPQQIQWESGEREQISVEQVASADFITFKPGQPVEAIVARDPVDLRLLQIVHIERRSAASRLSQTEESDLLKSIGSSKVLPAAGWD